MDGVRAAIVTGLLLAAVGVAGWRLIEAPARVAQAQAPSRPADLVASVSFTGADVSPHATRAQLATQRGDTLAPADLEADRRLLEASLREQGFWQAIVAPAEVRVGPSGAHVVFAIERGAPFRAGAITVGGVAPELALELERGLTIATGDAITPSAIARNQALLGDLLTLRRLAGHVVRPIATVDATAHRVEVNFEIERIATTGRGAQAKR